MTERHIHTYSSIHDAIVGVADEKGVVWDHYVRGHLLRNDIAIAKRELKDLSANEWHEHPEHPYHYDSEQVAGILDQLHELVHSEKPRGKRLAGIFGDSHDEIFLEVEERLTPTPPKSLR